jgi:hypothetical protein
MQETIICRCRFRFEGCINKCTVSRKNKLQERDCSECGFDGGKYKYDVVKKSGKIRRRK